MAYPYNPYQAPYYPPYQPPVPDQLAQLRQSQMQPVQSQAQQPMMTQSLLRPVQTATSVQAGPVDDRIWVQGEGAATSYLMAPNGFVRLWDSTAPVFYEKQADEQGKPLPLRIFDYTERTAPPRAPQAAPNNPQVDHVTRQEYNALVARVDALAAEKQAKPAKKTAKEEPENG